MPGITDWSAPDAPSITESPTATASVGVVFGSGAAVVVVAESGVAGAGASVVVVSMVPRPVALS